MLQVLISKCWKCFMRSVQIVEASLLDLSENFSAFLPEVFVDETVDKRVNDLVDVDQIEWEIEDIVGCWVSVEQSQLGRRHVVVDLTRNHRDEEDDGDDEDHHGRFHIRPSCLYFLFRPSSGCGRCSKRNFGWLTWLPRSFFPCNFEAFVRHSQTVSL